MIAVYGMSVSGNCHKVRLLLELLQLAYRWIEVDSAHGATRTPEFLALNPNGKVPIVVLEDGRVLAESNAILYFLAQNTEWFAGDEFERARVMSWLFFEQYSHEPYVAVARFIRGWTDLQSARRGAEFARCIERGNQALAVMERHLESSSWFSGRACGIADIALHAYTHCAGDGGFDLSRYPAIGRWLAAVEALPGFVPMPAISAEVAARLQSQRRL